jgi:hypothetical protein
MRAAPATPVAPKAPPVDTEKKPVAGAAQAPDMDAMMKKFEAAMDEGGPVNEGVLAEVTGDNWNGHTYPDVTLSEATKSCIKDHWFGNLIGPKTFEGPAGTKDMVIGCGARTYAEQYAAGRFLGSKTLTDESEAFMHSHGY